MPKEFQEELLGRISVANSFTVEPPTKNPVFVGTDIENSTYIWAQAPEGMAVAIALHDDILREELVHFNGYEITTCGSKLYLTC